MDSDKSLDEVKVIAALLSDFQQSHESMFTSRACRLTLKKVEKRVRAEGLGFLTKTLPRLGKALDKALTNSAPMSATKLGFKPLPNSELPSFLGEFFTGVLNHDGTVLPDPCAKCVAVLRQILYLFYKYELPYTYEQEQHVLQKFERTEEDLSDLSASLDTLSSEADKYTTTLRRRHTPSCTMDVIRKARSLLSRLFASFDCKDITPKHGPGSVSTREQLSGKYEWSNVSARIASVYPIDEYYYSSLSHVCDRLQELTSLKSEDHSARVILVPKDSRGPRLISCEPVDFQWIQQGLGRAIVQHVEQSYLTKYNVFFTDQETNRRGALLGSMTGRYATLDLNEASDRVSLSLVRLLFPPRIFEYLENCRSLCTQLPDGRILKLKKFAPMGSALCFPILALTTWAILTSGVDDTDTSDGIVVYGDDVIVPTAYAAKAIELLESFGLKVNRDKSCTSGFFRESCGMDAFKGIPVTPVRIRTVWSSSRTPESYSSWIEYSRSFYKRKLFQTYDYIVSALVRLYGPIPGDDLHLECPSLPETPVYQEKLRQRSSKKLQKLQYRVLDVTSPKVKQEIDGWSMLFRYFTEHSKDLTPIGPFVRSGEVWNFSIPYVPFSVRSYTRRKTSKLVYRWR